MNNQQRKGKSKQIKGKVREEIGKLIKNRSQENKGKIEQVEGKVIEGIGKSRKKFKI
jgi:uncharacterized protein YjbJ (UPF0337 family)